MPPKKGAKGKGKKGGEDDDAHWEKLASKLAPAPSSPAAINTTSTYSDEEEESIPVPASKNKSKKSNFASLDYADLELNPDDEDDGEGGDSLMATLNKGKKDKDKSGKKDKKKKKAYSYSDEEALAAEEEEAALNEPKVDSAEPRGAIEVGADDWMEAEFGKDKEKKAKKGKKGKQQKDNVDDEDWDAVLKKAQELKISEVEATAKVVATSAVEVVKDEVEEEEETGSKVLSKSEKEKIKKEKEKAKKKAQAAAKKASGPSTTIEAEPITTPATTTTTTETETVEPTEDAQGGEEEGEGEVGTSKNAKNKKKKKTAAEKKLEVAAAAATKKGGAGGAQMNALRVLVEAQRKAAEEIAAAQEAARLQYEEEERRLEEEEKLAAEEKARRKEKEKAKRDQLKKEGKLLTPKQKADKLAAEIRLKSFLGNQSVTIAGLAPSSSTSTPGEEGEKRKVSYAKKKFVRGGQNGNNASVEKEVEKVEVVVPEVVEVKKSAEDDDVKDDWDASDAEDDKADVKDDWDASSAEEEEEKVVAPVVVVAPKVVVPPPTKPVVSKAPVKPTPKSAASKPNGKISAPVPTKPVSGKILRAAIKPTLQGKARTPAAAAVVESSSEEESDDDDDDSDDDSDSDSDDSDDDSDDDSSSDEETNAMARQFAQKKAEAKERRLAKEKEALAARSKDNMRSPICVILGHVDTGKTKLLDKIRQTNVQEGEAGGITQQIGATYFPMDAIKAKTSVLGDADLKEYKLPGLLVIDTPGHESFTNLRTRGSSLCNIAILVVDIMHGLEPQTLESLRLLRDGKTPFIVALNKIDRLYGWKPILDGGFQESLASQAESVQREYKDRLSKTVLAFAEQGLNSLPYYENKDFARVVSLVPTSAHTGEGVPDMLMLIIKLTQERMTERLMYLSTLECTVLEVKVIEGLGTTIDVVLSNGVLHEGDRIVVCGLNGAISTQIRALLTPQPMKELRIKGQYVHHKEVKASLGIKIVAPDLEKAIAGSRLLVVTADDDEDELREDIMSDLTNLMDSVDKSGRGVCVQASTLGSLEALLEFLRTSKIPVSGINIGPVHRKDVMRAASMLEKAKELAVILCFDVPVDKEAEKLADELGIKIFKADIIYHLFDAFKAYNDGIVESKRVDSAPKAVWPCKLKILQCFTKRDPIIIGCDITEGTLRVGTPLCVVKTDPETKKKDIIYLGKVTSLEINHKVKEVVKRSEVGAGVAVKIEHASYESAKQFGRHFDENDEIISMVSRVSIDTLKEHFRDDVTKDDWVLIKQLKIKLGVD